MKAYIPQLRQSMADEAFFKKVYLWTFNWARTQGQKGLPLEVATEWWRLLFQHRFANHLESWLTFLTEKWNKSVPKDTWNMLYDFVLFAEKDPKLESYDEEGKICSNMSMTKKSQPLFFLVLTCIICKKHRCLAKCHRFVCWVLPAVTVVVWRFNHGTMYYRFPFPADMKAYYGSSYL